jgi:hypothetical protein
MTSNQVVYTMFKFNICNHMDGFVFWDDGNEYHGYCHMDLGCNGLFMSLY